MDRSVELVNIGFQEPDTPPSPPQIRSEEYERRLSALLNAVDTEWAVVYRDRNHVGNIIYLCGHGPRFEEELLVPGRKSRSGGHMREKATASRVRFVFKLAFNPVSGFGYAPPHATLKARSISTIIPLISANQ